MPTNTDEDCRTRLLRTEQHSCAFLRGRVEGIKDWLCDEAGAIMIGIQANT